MLHMHRYKRNILRYKRTRHPHANIAAGGPEHHQTQMNTTHRGLSAHTEFFHLISNCSATLAPPTEHAVFPAPCKQDAQDLSAC